MEQLRKLLDQAREIWGRLGLSSRIIILASLALLIIGVIALTVTARLPDYTDLYTGLSPQDSAQIETRLKEMGVRYQTLEGGARIRVPSRRRAEVLLALSAQGLPTSGSIGWEFLSKTDFTSTQWTLEKKNIIALQTELARTITQIDGVEGARIHIATPQEALYSEKEKEPTASVLLKLRPGATLDEERIRGIMGMVSHSVDGLKPSNVTVMDTNGHVLSEVAEPPAAGKASPRLSQTQLGMQRDFQKDIERKIQSMLDEAIGPDKAIVRVSAQLEFDEKKMEEEVFTPHPGTDGLVRSRQSKKEKYEGYPPGAGGPPGTPTNTGTPPAGYKAPAAQGSPARYNKEELIENKEHNRKKTLTENAPGTKPARIQVGVLVDSSIQKSDIDRIHNVVASFAGIDPARGDTISVQAIPFERGARELASRQLQEEIRLQRLWQAVRVLWPILTVLFLVLAALWVLRGAMPRKKEAEEKPRAPAFPEISTFPPPPFPQATIPPFVPPPVEIPAFEGEEPTSAEGRRGLSEMLKKRSEAQSMVLEEVEELVNSKPEVAAELLRSWLVEK
ncbi:MAG: flagellar M-ring protein FliF [Armatimonadetes bacterium]|nr:flagellar M-ring protein FliF [Armatimonadota bacterium]